MKKAAAVIILSFILAAGLTALGDQVILKSGRVIEGDIVEQTADSVTVETTDADGFPTSTKIPIDKVERVVSDQNNGGARPADIPELVLQNGHSNSVFSIAFNSDGKTIASVSSDNTVKLWSTETGELFHSIEMHLENVNSVVFSPDGQTIASASLDNTVKLWSVETGELLHTLEGHSDDVEFVVFSADGKYIASVSRDKTVKQWSADTGELLHTFEGYFGGSSSVAFSPDGKIIALGSENNTVNLWSADTGELLHSLIGHSRVVFSVAFSPDGKTIASGSVDNTVKLWSTTTGELLHTLEGHYCLVDSVVFSPDGKTVATGSCDKTVKLWSAETGELFHSLEGHSETVISVVFSPDGKTIASGSWDNTVKLWSAETGELLHSLEGHSGGCTSVVFSPDGKTVASGSWDNMVKLWSVQTGEMFHSLEGHSDWVNSVFFSKDGKTITSVSSDNTVKLWSTETGELFRSLDMHLEEVNSVVFSPDGNTIASAGRDNWVKLWSAQTGELLHIFERHWGGGCFSVAFSPDGKIIAAGSRDGTVKLWSAETGELFHFLEGHSEEVISVAFSPDGETVASGSGDNTVKLWSTETGEQLHSLEGHSYSVDAVAFNPDGETVASGSDDNTVKLWSADTGELLRSFVGHSARVTSVVFSPDGKTIASGSVDNTVKLWSADTGELLRSFVGHSAGVTSVVFSPDGKTIASGSGDTTIKLWNPATGQELATLTAFDDGNWFVTDPAGHYDCSGCATNDENSGAKYLRWRVGNVLIKPEQVKEQLFVPNLLGKIVHGDSLTDANLSDLSAQLAPTVRFASPHEGNTIEESMVDVEITVTDMGGDVKDVTLYQDGIALNDVKPDVELAPGGDANTKLYIFHGVRLLSGTNRLTADAASDKGVRSRMTEVNVNCVSDDIPPMKLFVLTIGINDYAYQVKNLNYAKADADDVAKALEQGGARLFTGGIVSISLRDTDATREHIRAALDRIKKESGPDDTIVVYYSGHGKAIGNIWYLLPHELVDFDKETIERDALSHTELEDFFSRVRSRRKILILDSCQSGQVEMSMNLPRGGLDEEIFQEMNTSAGVYILTSAAAAETARENYGLQHGIFTYALLLGLSGKADANSGPTIEASELVNFTQSYTYTLSKKLFHEKCEKEWDTLSRDEKQLCDMDVAQRPVNKNVAYGGVGGLGPTLVEPALVNIDLVPVL